MSQNNPFDNNLYKCAACIGIFIRSELEFYEYNGEHDYEAYCELCKIKKIDNEKEEKAKFDEEYACYNERIIIKTEEDFIRKYCYENNYDLMFEEFKYAGGGGSYLPKANPYASDAQNIIEEIQRRFILDIADDKFKENPEKMIEIAKRIKNQL